MVKLEYGKPLAKEDRTPDGDYGVYGANGIKNYSNKAYSKGPSIIVGRKGSAGELTFVTGDFWPLDVTYFTQHNSDLIELKFLMLLLEMANLPSMAKGVKPGINRNDVYALQIPLPPLEEQKRIVSILDEAFEGLDRARENAKANLKSARELFTASSKKLMLNDPIQPSGDTSKNNIINLIDEIERKKEDKKFRGPLVLGADTFPEIPTSWFWSSPEQLSTNIVDCLHTTPEWSDSGKVCLRTTNFQPNFLDLTSSRYVSDETYAKRIVRLEPKPGDVLYSREGGILGIACEFPPGLEACLGQRMMMFRLRREWILPTYFCWVMNSDFILKEVTRLTGGAAAPHLNIGDIRRFPIPVPPMAIQRQIVEELGQFHQSHNQLLEKLRTKLQDISDLRQSLLQKAFAGELT